MTTLVLSSANELGLANDRLAQAAPQEILAWVYERFHNVVIVASFQVESSVLIDMAWRLRGEVRVLTLDTGRLPQETHDLIDQVRERYGIAVEVQTPDGEQVGGMTSLHGTNLFYRSKELRLLCCDVRKVRPLTRALEGVDAWITGLRRDQVASRAATPVVSADAAHGGIAKAAPLAQWRTEQVWDYIRRHDVPYHALYERGYTSIGCVPCTRPTQPGEDPRAGRWWWEPNGVKECGLHWTATRPETA